MKRLLCYCLTAATITIFFLTLVTMARAAGNYPAEYIKNYDSDSITLKVWLWPGTNKTSGGLFAEENMRLYGIDTPEKGWRAACEYERNLSADATSYVTQVLSMNPEVRIDVQKARGARGRPLIRIYVPQEDGSWVNLNESLITQGYARPYFGKTKRKSWCK